MTDLKSCERCGEPHERCSAHNRAGKPCGLWPLAGQRVCKLHGGAAPQSLAKAEERVLADQADTEIRKLWVGLANATPVTDPVEAMSRLAGALQEMADRVGDKVNEITHLAGGESMSQLRGEVVLLERVLAQLGRHLDSMARLGIAERQVQLQADQAELVSSAFRAAVSAVASSLLTPGDKDLMLRTFLTGIGVDVTSMLEAGQVPA